MSNFSICWDCKYAVGGCSWSNRLKPVEGWKATKIKQSSTRPYSTYVVEECPSFVRDAIGGGLKRYKEINLKGDK